MRNFSNFLNCARGLNYEAQNLFTPYEPPAHHPAHSILHPEVKAELQGTTDEADPHRIKSENDQTQAQSLPLFVEKLDPYDEGKFLKETQCPIATHRLHFVHRG